MIDNSAAMGLSSLNKLSNIMDRCAKLPVVIVTTSITETGGSRKEGERREERGERERERERESI